MFLATDVQHVSRGRLGYDYPCKTVTRFLPAKKTTSRKNEKPAWTLNYSLGPTRFPHGFSSCGTAESTRQWRLPAPVLPLRPRRPPRALPGGTRGFTAMAGLMRTQASPTIRPIATAAAAVAIRFRAGASAVATAPAAGPRFRRWL